MSDANASPAKHHVVIGLGGEGFRAACTCGWSSATNWDRDAVARDRDDHAHRSRPRSANAWIVRRRSDKIIVGVFDNESAAWALWERLGVDTHECGTWPLLSEAP